MISKENLRLMIRIALHEKKYNAKDSKINQFFRNDYIYKNNAINRIGIFVGLCLISFIVVLDMIYVQEVDIFTLDYKALGTKFLVISFIIFSIYTVIGIFKYGKEYDTAQKRYKKYFLMLAALDRRKADSKKPLRGKSGGSNGRNIAG